MNLINKKVMVVDPGRINYGKVGVCKAYESNRYIVYFDDLISTYKLDEIMPIEEEEEKEMTAFEILLKYWNIEIGEKFNIEDSYYNPYYFNKKQQLIDCDGDVCIDTIIYKLVMGYAKIQKIPAKEMTIAEIEKELGYPIKVVGEKKKDA